MKTSAWTVHRLLGQLIAVGAVRQERSSHTKLATSGPIVDAGDVAVGYSCVAMGIGYGSPSGVAVVSTLIPASKPTRDMLEATRKTARRIAASLDTLGS